MTSPLAKAVLDSRLSLEGKCQIINTFWECNFSAADITEAQISCYFNFYFQQCQHAYALSSDSALLTSHEDIVTTVQHLKRPTLSRETISQRVKQHFSGRLRNMDPHKQDQLLLTAIDLCLSLWLMIRIGHFRQQISLESTVIWQNRSTMEDFLEEQFPRWRPPSGPQSFFQKPLTLEKVFNARNLDRIAGMDIYWTDSLVDHLLLKERKDGNSTLFIFHNVSFLRFHKNWYVGCNRPQKNRGTD